MPQTDSAAVGVLESAEGRKCRGVRATVERGIARIIPEERDGVEQRQELVGGRVLRIGSGSVVEPCRWQLSGAGVVPVQEFCRLYCF